MSMSLRAIHHSCARRSPARPPAHVRRFLPERLGRYRVERHRHLGWAGLSTEPTRM